MIKLNKDPTRKPTEWVKAPEFIPVRYYIRFNIDFVLFRLE